MENKRRRTHIHGRQLTSKSPIVNRVAASESVGGKSGLIIYLYSVFFYMLYVRVY